MTSAPAPVVLAVGDVGPSIHLGPITRTDIVRYAGAAGDFTPMHHDEDAARAAGYPSVFAMGLYLGGVMARAVVDWVGLGSLRSYEVSFRRQVWPGDEIAIRSRVVQVGTDLATIAVEADRTVGADPERGPGVVASASAVVARASS